MGRDMWIYLLGPFVALLPQRWRRALSFHDAIRWRSASILSGLAESVVALVALLYWYSYSMTTWVSNALDNALSGKTAPGTTDQEIGFAALIVFATHPLTWTIAFFGLEGMARLCTALTDTVLGVFPLYLVEKIYSMIFRRGRPGSPATVIFEQSHVSSYVGTVRDKVMTAGRERLPDELCILKSNSEEFLEIRASRPKPDWEPPRTVRYDDRYYRLEEAARASGQRSYIYKLRLLSAGVPGRSVLIYSPDEASILATR